MLQKDYNLRVAEYVGQALAQIIYHKEIQDYQGALSLIDESFKQAVGAGSGFIHAISEETLLAMLTLLGVLNLEKALKCGHQHMKKTGVAYVYPFFAVFPELIQSSFSCTHF